jgi:hypothetical protein
MSMVSRRRFLGSAAALPLAFHTPLAKRIAATPSPEQPAIKPGCRLVDLQEHCVLRESLAGFARGLEAASIAYSVTADALKPARFIVVPGALLASNELAATLSRCCKLGSTVIYESGAAYAGEEAFRTEQRLLRNHFDLAIDPPVELWDASESPLANALPYVHYHWPCQVIVRDFSRAIPVAGTANVFGLMEAPYIAYHHQATARIGKLCVCSSSRAAKGEFVFLGSALGPHLVSGDREAQSVLRGLLASTS